MPTHYNQVESNVAREGKTVNVKHCHAESATWDKDGKRLRDPEMRQQVTKINGCIAFFTAYKLKCEDPREIAACEQAIKEDKTRLRDCPQQFHNDCLVL